MANKSALQIPKYTTLSQALNMLELHLLLDAQVAVIAKRVFPSFVPGKGNFSCSLLRVGRTIVCYVFISVKLKCSYLQLLEPHDSFRFEHIYSP